MFNEEDIKKQSFGNLAALLLITSLGLLFLFLYIIVNILKNEFNYEFNLYIISVFNILVAFFQKLPLEFLALSIKIAMSI